MSQFHRNRFSARAVALGALVALTLSGASKAYADMNDEIQTNVRKHWQNITELCHKTQALTDELPNLADAAWWRFNDKGTQLKKIHALQSRIRSELLTVDSQDVLKRAEKISQEMAHKREEIAALREKRSFESPDRQSEIDSEIASKESQIENLSKEYTQEMNHVKGELAAIGLPAKGDNLNVLLSMADRADIIDNVIVAKSIAEMVNALKSTLKDGDALSAKRYYAVYLVLTDVHSLCFEQYLEKSRKGEWREGLDRLEKMASSSVAAAQKAISSGDYTPDRQAVFQRTISDNNRLLTGVGLYRKLLDSHESAVERKLAEVKKQRVLVESLYSTAAGTVNFGNLVDSVQGDFTAVMSLELPDIEIVDDGISQDQLDAISKMLDMK